MAAGVRVARVEELPPGRGRVVEIAGREIAVYNLEGRYFAGALRTRPSRRPRQLGCPPGGRWFDALAEDSPARLHHPVVSYRVVVIEEFVVVEVDWPA